MKKTKLLAALMTAACLSFGGAIALSASAEGGLSVGSLSGQGGATVEGTKDGKTKISWGAAGADVYTSVKNYNNENITVKLTASADTSVRIALVQGSSPWGKLVEISAATATANVTYEAKAENVTDKAFENCNLFIYLDEGQTVSETKTAVIEEVKIGDVSYTPTAYVEPTEPTERLLADYTDWTASSNVTVSANPIGIAQEDGVKDGIGSVRFTDLSAGTYTDAEGAEVARPVYVRIPITGVPTGWNTLYLKYKKSAGIGSIQLYANGIIDSEAALNPQNDGIYICGDIESAWNATVSKSSPEGYSLSAVSMGNYLDGVNSKHDLYIKINFAEGAAAADEALDFGGIVWAASAPTFATDQLNLDVEIGEFKNGDSASQYTLVNNPEADGEIPAGLVKVSYETETSRKFIEATVSNVKKSMTRLVIDYYTTSGEEVNFGVYFGSSSVQGYKKFPAGHGSIDIDLTGKVPDGAFKLRIYIDRKGQNDTAAPNTVVIKSITFGEPVSVGDPEVAAWVSRFTLDKKAEGTEISWPEKVGTDYNAVTMSVGNWTSLDRFLKLTFTPEKTFTLAVYQGQGNALMTHTLFEGGKTHTIYVDTTKGQVPVTDGNWVINLFIDATEDSLANKMLLQSVEFVKEGVHAAPDSSAITIDFTAEMLSFGETIEVFSDSEGTVAVESGSAVTPGAKLWMRTKAGDSQKASELVEYNVPARPEISELTPSAVTDSTIEFAETGYSFKLGDGEWTETGKFEELDAETEYTIRIRKEAAENAFASEEITVTVTTKATVAPPDSSSSGSANTSGSSNTSNTSSSGNGGCGSSVAMGTAAVLALCGAALLAKKKKND